MKESTKENLVYVVVIAFVLSVIVGGVYLVFGSASFGRAVKSIKSNYGGGIERRITLYDYNGKAIQTWEGKFDVAETQKEVYFDDENGKRTIITNGIVVNQEK